MSADSLEIISIPTTSPTGAIIGSVKNPHFIIEEKCISCGVCFSVCKFDAISKK